MNKYALKYLSFTKGYKNGQYKDSIISPSSKIQFFCEIFRSAWSICSKDKITKNFIFAQRQRWLSFVIDWCKLRRFHRHCCPEDEGVVGTNRSVSSEVPKNECPVCKTAFQSLPLRPKHPPFCWLSLAGSLTEIGMRIDINEPSHRGEMFFWMHLKGIVEMGWPCPAINLFR